jgi:hypothetical protein
MEDFSTLDRKQKIKEFRRRANEMQVVKNGRLADQAFQLARKLGREQVLQREINSPAMYRRIDSRDETALWAQVVSEMMADPNANRKGPRMAVLEK